MKTLSPYLLVSLITLLLCELTIRVFFSVTQGPDFFFYGFNDSQMESKKADAGDSPDQLGADQHNVKIGKYSKYEANSLRNMKHKRSGKIIKVQINNHGFRGPNFEVKKPEDTFRIVTLGASSTFGYWSADDETYPHFLQEILDRDCSRRTFEVVNLGVPHLRSEQILALFDSEGVPLKPDLVTFYEGVNDTMGPLVSKPVESVRKLVTKYQWAYDSYRALRSVSLLIKFFDFNSRNNNLNSFNAEQVEAYISDSKSEIFLQNVKEMKSKAVAAGSDFWVVNQQSQSRMLSEEQRRGISYADEVKKVEAKLASEGGLNESEVYFLTHNVFVNKVKEWASSTKTPVVDGIKKLDLDRHTLLTWVHLDAEGNRLLAEAIAEKVLKNFCRSGS